MKRLLIAIVIPVVLFAFSGYGTAAMITNDDLERKYPSESQPDREAWKKFNERSQIVDCERIRQDTALARRDAYRAPDPQTKKEKLAEYDRLYSEYYKKCVQRR